MLGKDHLMVNFGSAPRRLKVAAPEETLDNDKTPPLCHKVRHRRFQFQHTKDQAMNALTI